MKVLYIIDSLYMGGAENLLLPLARVAPTRGFTIDVVSLAPELEAHRNLVDGLRAAGLTPTMLPIRGLTDPNAIPQLVSAIRASGCDLVHGHLQYSAILAPPAAWLARRPCVCTLHHLPQRTGTRDGIKEWLAVSIGGRSRGLIFVSSAAQEAFARRYRRNGKTWTVIRNGIDLSHFVPETASFPADLGIPPRTHAAVLVGSMRGTKGHADAIRAWPEVCAHVPGARLVFVGSGPEERQLRAMATRLSLSHLITFAGSRTDVAQIMRASALVLLPSISEALPTVLMEAAACGRPVVATAVGGIPEVVQDGETGVLISVADVPHLAQAIVALFIDSARRRKMGAAARRLAEERFGVDAWSGRLRAVYDAVVAGSPIPEVPAVSARDYVG